MSRSAKSHRQDRRQAIFMPSEVSSRVGFFDRFAGWSAVLASRAPFFAFCVVLIAGWLTQGLITVLVTGRSSAFLESQYQLEINTTTTIITFLMVALLQNSQTREDQATQHKLNAIADGLADLMEHLAEDHKDDGLRQDIKELRMAVGLEVREGTTHNAAEAGESGKGATRH